MAGDHYSAFIEEAFIDPIRSVLIVDDDFPTYDEILATANSSAASTRAHRDKAWRTRPERIANLIGTFRSRPRRLLVDIHDGANVPAKKEVTTAGHLHQCDLLVLDYELDRTKPRDGTRAVEILRALMSNNHFNLVVIYTNEDLDFVFDFVRWGLITPHYGPISEEDTALAMHLIEEGEDSIDNFAAKLRGTISSAQYFHSRLNQKSFLRTMSKGQQPYTLYRQQADLVEWSSKQRTLVLRHLLREAELANSLDLPSQVRFSNLEWSSRDPKWVKSDSAFIAFSPKTDNNDDILSVLKQALGSWGPRPSRLFLTKLRADIDEYGVAAQGPALRNHHALAYWYYRLLADSAEGDRRWRIAESISRQSTQLLDGVQSGVEDFASRLIDAEIASGEPIAICDEHFGVNLADPSEKMTAILEHNAFVSGMEPKGWHLTTGHVFSISDEYWLCLSPACDMVPAQIPAWHNEMFGKRLPFLAVKLYNLKSRKAVQDVHSNRYLFLRGKDDVLAYCFNDPSRELSAPRWQQFFAENQGKFTGQHFQFRLSHIRQGKRSLVSQRLPAQVISQIRYEYALNLIQKLGVSLTRVGLDFSGGAEAEV